MSITEAEREGVKKVRINNDVIFVTVSDNPEEVGQWATLLKDVYPVANVGRPLVVGVRVEWRRSLRTGLWRRLDHRVDILQLCVNKYCLIFQIRHASHRNNIPEQFVEICGDNRFTFVGVGIRRDVEILKRDYGIDFGENIMDLRDVFLRMRRNNRFWWFRRVAMNYYGLEDLYKLVCQRNYVRPIKITFSKWDKLVLDDDQIMHACAAAYICYTIGQILLIPP